MFCKVYWPWNLYISYDLYELDQNRFWPTQHYFPVETRLSPFHKNSKSWNCIYISYYVAICRRNWTFFELQLLSPALDFKRLSCVSLTEQNFM
jgi:hypothetical protein